MLTALELEAALAGQPVRNKTSGVGYINLNHNPDYYILDFLNGDLLRVEKSKILQMDLNLFKFKHWDLISSKFISMEKRQDWYWRLHVDPRHTSRESVAGHNENLAGFKLFSEYDFIKGFFPECPIGTTITRPKNED